MCEKVEKHLSSEPVKEPAHCNLSSELESSESESSESSESNKHKHKVQACCKTVVVSSEHDRDQGVKGIAQEIRVIVAGLGVVPYSVVLGSPT